MAVPASAWTTFGFSPDEPASSVAPNGLCRLDDALEDTFQVRLQRPIPFPPDTRAGIDPILKLISRSSWLSIALVALILAISVWALQRRRRSIARQTSMHFLLNSVVVITALLLVVLGLAAVDVLVAPGAVLQTFFGASCVPNPRTTLLILFGTCIVAAIVEAVITDLRAS